MEGYFGERMQLKSPIARLQLNIKRVKGELNQRALGKINDFRRRAIGGFLTDWELGEILNPESDYMGMIGLRGGDIVGGMAWKKYEGIEITSIAVDENFRGRGIGSQMLEEIAIKTPESQLITAFVSGASFCLPIHNFFKNNGYRAVDIIRRGTDQEAYQFQRYGKKKK